MAFGVCTMKIFVVYDNPPIFLGKCQWKSFVSKHFQNLRVNKQMILFARVSNQTNGAKSALHSTGETSVNPFPVNIHTSAYNAEDHTQNSTARTSFTPSNPNLTQVTSLLTPVNLNNLNYFLSGYDQCAHSKLIQGLYN